MIPNSVSATSLKTAKECLAKYWAENIEYARGWSNPAALLGTCCHEALQKYVDEVYIQQIKQPSTDRLRDYFELYFLKAFGVSGEHDAFREQGIEMMERWSAREAEHFTGRKVLNLEERKFLYIETSAGPIKLNYILDRFDEVSPGHYEIVDYKSQRKNITSRNIHEQLQPDIYALAKFIEYPDAVSMSVVFDMLRYDITGPIEITKERSRAFFAELCELIERIIATSPENAEETLNPACNYCIRKAGCKTLQKNIDVGGLFSLSLEQQIDLRTQIELQVKGLTALSRELDEVVEESLGKDLKMELETPKSRAFFTTGQANKLRDIDAVETIVGTDLFYRYGKRAITLDQFKKLLKDPALAPEQVEKLKGLQEKKWKDPQLNYENRRSDAESAVLSPDTSGKLAPAVPRAPILGLD